MGGWELPSFNKLFYPPKQKKPASGGRKLEFYSKYFDSVEVNATFYNPQFSPEIAKNWIKDVSENKDFVFTVKLYRGFTHTFKVLKREVRSIQKFLDVFASAGKLGGLLIQFPYAFVYNPARCRYIMELSRTFRQHRLFVEVRHYSWDTPAMYNFFQDNKLHLVNVDLPHIKEHIRLNALAWDGAAYFRMMGRNAVSWDNPWRPVACVPRTHNSSKWHVISDRYNYLYSEGELQHLFSLIESVKERSNTTFVVFHNDPEANSLINGFRMRYLAQKKKIPVPQNMTSSFPELKTISENAATHQTLFNEI
jgi:uncharacterized protein YecE (DUF72 family)